MVPPATPSDINVGPSGRDKTFVSDLGPLFSSYELGAHYDEMFESSARPRAHCDALVEELRAGSQAELGQRQLEADKAFLTQGITFTVYGDTEGTERIFPFDLVPRIITASEWRDLERGLAQRLTAVNLFLKDVYHDARILAEGVVPRDLVQSCKHYRREMRGVHVHRDIYVSVAGTDLVRLEDGRFVVLEDNLRVPSGVSYMLENREVTKRVLPGLFDRYRVSHLALRSGAAGDSPGAGAPVAVDPTFVVLTPGVGNSATSSTRFSRGRNAGGGRDPRPRQHRLHAHDGRTQRVDVIYRRTTIFWIARVPHGLASGRRGVAQCIGRATCRFTPGTGLADGKALYAPSAIIKFYLSEDRFSNVETCLSARLIGDTCSSSTHRREGGGESGGYCVDRPAQHGRRARGVQGEDSGRPAQLHRAADAVTLVRPCFMEHGIEPAGGPASLRPLRRSGDGGAWRLTRVAPKRFAGRRSSQGPGKQDTWVLETGSRTVLLSRVADSGSGDTRARRANGASRRRRLDLGSTDVERRRLGLRAPAHDGQLEETSPPIHGVVGRARVRPSTRQRFSVRDRRARERRRSARNQHVGKAERAVSPPEAGMKARSARPLHVPTVIDGLFGVTARRWGHNEDGSTGGRSGRRSWRAGGSALGAN